MQVDAGGDLIVTQLFYDVEIFMQFIKDCRSVGIKCPIVPGEHVQRPEPLAHGHARLHLVDLTQLVRSAGILCSIVPGEHMQPSSCLSCTFHAKLHLIARRDLESQTPSLSMHPLFETTYWRCTALSPSYSSSSRTSSLLGPCALSYLVSACRISSL